MTELTTRYMGIELESPIIVAASSISSMVDRIEMAEQAGAGALVIRSLFEEQMLTEILEMEETLAKGSESFPEALQYFPKIELHEAGEHLMWVRKARAAVKMPLIASLNAYSTGAWLRYAKQLEETGVDGLELNVYAIATNPHLSGSDIERTLFEVVEQVKAEVKLPVAVKLSPFYSSVANVAIQLTRRGADALVLFNRFLQPDINPADLSLSNKMSYSSPEEIRLPLRWIALLYGQVETDLALSTGAHSGSDVAKVILAGASGVQVASTLLMNGIPYLSTMVHELETWMVEHGFNSVAEFKGRLSQQEVADPFAYERAQYVRLLRSQ
ncbi:MAG: dihydroorotate dehydrogenase-like protein [Anaerolineales bacterium]|nr:dihydroorotate dehydrogenase-like protein [Anaerolineales bacterium]